MPQLCKKPAPPSQFLPLNVEFEELIATADDPENYHAHYAYVRTKDNAFYKCNVTCQNTDNSRFAIVKCCPFSKEQVLADAFSFPDRDWRWHHEPIVGAEVEDNHDFLRSMVDWHFNRVHKMHAQRIKPSWNMKKIKEAKRMKN